VWIHRVGGSIGHRAKGFDAYFGESRVRGAHIQPSLDLAFKWFWVALDVQQDLFRQRLIF
jgi:hypothetical protein